MQVFYTSPWVPAEWIRAHGLEPRGVWFAREFAFDPLPLAAGVCAFAHAVVRLAERERESAVIFTTHCDQLRRGFDAVAGAAPARLFLFNLPATWQTPVAQRIFCSELERLGRFLVELGGHAPAPKALLEIMTQYGQARRRLLEAAAGCPAREYAEAIARFHWDGSVGLLPAPAPMRNTAAEATPLALVGGPLPQSQWGLLEAMEKAGGRVVLNATEAGERSLWLAPSWETLRKNPSAAEVPALREDLARAYLENCVDVFQRPNTRLYTWLEERLAARRVRGLVLWHYVGCDLWRGEAHTLREALGLPVLLLDADETASPERIGASGWPRAAGRIEAFIESLQ